MMFLIIGSRRFWNDGLRVKMDKCKAWDVRPGKKIFRFSINGVSATLEDLETNRTVALKGKIFATF